MGEVHRLPNPEDTEREAGDWFARMNADDVTEDDHARFPFTADAQSMKILETAETTTLGNSRRILPASLSTAGTRLSPVSTIVLINSEVAGINPLLPPSHRCLMLP
jgi:hypothetical protein